MRDNVAFTTPLFPCVVTNVKETNGSLTPAIINLHKLECFVIFSALVGLLTVVVCLFSGSRAPQPPSMSTSKMANSKSKGSGGKGSKDPVQRPCQAHSFHTDAAEVQKMERELLTLLGDFNSGKLRAFGEGFLMYFEQHFL